MVKVWHCFCSMCRCFCNLRLWSLCVCAVLGVSTLKALHIPMCDARRTIFVSALSSMCKPNLCSKSSPPQAVVGNGLFSGLGMCWTVPWMGFVWLCSCVWMSACSFACP